MINMPNIGTLMVCWEDEAYGENQAYIITSKPGDNAHAERKQYIAGCKQFLRDSYPDTWETIPLLILPLDIQNTGLNFFNRMHEIVEEIDNGTYENESSFSILAGELFL